MKYENIDEIKAGIKNAFPAQHEECEEHLDELILISAALLGSAVVPEMKKIVNSAIENRFKAWRKEKMN